jgi:hypothetical protein
VIERAWRVLAALLATSLVVAAWHDVSQGYDAWYYHLPFAARLTGLEHAGAFVFSAENQRRFDGFPLFAELLQGLVWRLTGHVEATSFVSLGALFGLVLVLRRLYGVAASIALFAFMAIPLVHIHATSGYVDLFANACVTVLLLFLHHVLASVVPPSPKLLGVAALAAAAAANTKFQLVPVVVVASVALVVVTIRRGIDRRQIAIVGLAIPLVFATPIKNVVRHGNPVWPVELRLAGHTLPSAEAAYAFTPAHLRDAPRPVRFARSVLEIDNGPITERWSLDQWAPPSSPACRMGGFFGGYAIVLLGLLGLAMRRRTREALAAGGVFAGATVVAAFVPQSHELRYYMFWMLSLVALNLVLWRKHVAMSAAAMAAFVVVTWATDGHYVYPSGKTFATYLREHTSAAVLDSITPGERVCIGRQPFTFLYAPLFHPGKDYVVQERAEDADCAGARPLD